MSSYGNHGYHSVQSGTSPPPRSDAQSASRHIGPSSYASSRSAQQSSYHAPSGVSPSSVQQTSYRAPSGVSSSSVQHTSCRAPSGVSPKSPEQTSYRAPSGVSPRSPQQASYRTPSGVSPRSPQQPSYRAPSGVSPTTHQQADCDPSRSPPSSPPQNICGGQRVVVIPVKHTGYRPECHAKQYTAYEDQVMMDLPPTKTMMHHFPESHEIAHCYEHAHLPPKKC